MLTPLVASLFFAIPAPGTIAFIGSVNGQPDLFTVRSDGSELRQLTNDLALESEPTWSPDGKKIAFIAAIPDSQRHLQGFVFAINPDGTNRIQVTNDEMSLTSVLSWSPDSNQIVFERVFQPNGVLSLSVAHSNGSSSSRITNATTSDRDPRWSSGGRISFLGTRTPGGSGIFSVRPDGSDTRLIKAPVGQFYGPANWSPDGTKLAYLAPNKGGITVIRADGSEAESVGESSPESAQWSLDSRQLVFVEGGGTGRVMVSTDSRMATPVSQTGMAFSPTFSPDSQRVAFVKTDGTDPVTFTTAYSLYVSDIGSGSPVKVPIEVRPFRVNGRAPFCVRWSPTDVTSSGGDPPAPGGEPTQKNPIVTAPPVGPGFPGTPTGPDRPSSPPGATKAYGTDLRISAPESVRVGNGFFSPQPLTIIVAKSAKFLKLPAKLVVTGLPPGVTATIDKNKLHLGGLSSLKIGEHVIHIKGTCGTATAMAPIRIIRERARILLVDDDFDGNNIDLKKDPSNFLKGSLSKSDLFYREMLNRGDGSRSLIFDTAGVDRYGNGPDASALQPYDLVIWYIGTSYGGNPDNSAVFSGTDESTIRAYLQEGGGRTMVMCGAGYISNVSRGLPTSESSYAHWTETDSTFLQKAMGVQGGRGMLMRFTDADLTANGQLFMMGKGPVEAQLSPINPKSSTPLVFAELNPDGKGVRNVPVAVWNRVGDGNLVYVGFSVENVAVRSAKLTGMLLGIRISGMASR